MAKNQDGQLELVLENRQLLIAFFVVVALCGVFFSLGYIVGRNTFSSVAHVTQSASGAEPATRPSPMPPAAYSSSPPPHPAPATAAPPDQSAPAADLNFYQSAEEKTPDPKLLPPDSQNAPARPAAEKPVSPEPLGVLVQVSALTRREDANALVALLKEKGLPVLVTSSSGDSLFHVVVGPLRNEKEAQGVKKALEDDGFRPIIKH
jgi:cell division septation protein DedD